MVFLYDSGTTPVGFLYTTDDNTTVSTWAPYYFAKNAQGDVLKVYDASMSEVASYTYDAWGKALTATGTMADINPIRYRSYYFDSDTSLYYLQSRYYDPAVGRFINADSYASTGQGVLGCNMYAYCGNNPCCRIDSFGDDWKTIVGIGLCIAVIGIAIIAAIPSGGSSLVLAGGVVSETGAMLSVGYSMASAGLLISGTAVATEAVTREAEYRRRGDGRIYSVYFLKDNHNRIRYVGRVKTCELNARLNYHKSTRNLTLYNSVSGLTYEEARGLEEIGMIQCNTLTRVYPDNMIHGISSENKNGVLYMFDAQNYLFNHGEQWLLNLLS